MGLRGHGLHAFPIHRGLLIRRPGQRLPPPGLTAWLPACAISAVVRRSPGTPVAAADQLRVFPESDWSGPLTRKLAPQI